ncbi:Zinc finger protein 37-like, partial [Homarus americanus]
GSDDHKTTEELETKGELLSLRSEHLDAVDTTVNTHTVLATIPAGVESLSSTDQIHVQLFDGQVIQITSASLVNPESRGRGGTRRKGCEVDERRDGRNGVIESELGAGGAVTLLTSDGKTYILPQALNGATGGYIIAEEVLSAEEVLQSSDVLQEEQVLTISPPQASLQFSSSVTTPPDALAIATSEVFNEEYVSLPLEEQPELSDRSKSFHFKAEERNNVQSSPSVDKEYLHPRQENSRESAPYSDCSVITIQAPNAQIKNAWLEKDAKEYVMSSSLGKSEISKVSDHQIYTVDTTESDPLAISNKDTLPRTLEDHKKQLNDANSASYSAAYTKWCEVRSDIPNYFPSNLQTTGNTNSFKKLFTEEIEEATEAGTIVENEKHHENLPTITLESTNFMTRGWDDDNGAGDQVLDQGKLRRSSRIRKTKKIPNKNQQLYVDEPSNRKRRKVIKGETNSSFWECNSCDAMFRTKASRDRHMEEGHTFTCYVCGWQGRSKTKYEFHISTVHCNQQARCLACRKDFLSYEVYKQHMKTKHSMTTTIAVKTEVEFEPQPEGAEQEEEEEQPQDVRYKKGDGVDPDDPDFKDSKAGLGKDDDFHSYGERGCPYCGKTFLRRSRFLRHLNYHRGNRSFRCTFCTKCFVEKSGLDAHIQTHCPINEPCPQCGKVFKTQRTMKRHLRTHQNKIYSCNVCGKEFRHDESLRVHKSVHKEGGSGNDCKICEKDCKTPYYLQLHMTTKHEAAKFICLQCNRSFKWKQSYRKHKAVHHEDTYMKFKCTVCPRHFLTPSELQLHQAVHTNERKYLCDICGKAFKHEYNRDKHIRTVHRDDCEHMCPQCGSLFKAKAYLDQHLAHVHTTKERVKCMHCEHDFKTESILRSHIKIVHTPRNPKYACKCCNKTFLAPKDLARHSKVHTGVKDYSCPKCSRCFSRKDNMAAHLRTHNTNQSASSSFDSKDDIITPSGVPQQNTPQGINHMLGLPSTNSPVNSIAISSIPESSNSIILSNVPVSSSSILISDASPSSNIVVPSVPTSENITLAVHSSSHSTTASGGGSMHSDTISLSNISISSASVLSNIVSSTNSIILSGVPISSTGISSTPASSGVVVFSGTPSSSNLVLSNTQSTSNNMALCHTHSNSTNVSLGNTSSSNNLVLSSSPTVLNTHPVPSSESRTGHQDYVIHPHIITSSQHQTSSISSIPSSSVPSSLLSLPPHLSSSTPLLMSQANRTQMVCTPFSPEQVVLTAGVLGPVSTVSTHHSDNPSQYTQLDQLETSISSSSSVNINATSNTLRSSGPTGTIGASVPMTVEGSHHDSTGGVSDPVESNIILPSASLLPDTALILPEKTGVYTIVEEGKMTTLETFTLHPMTSTQPPPSHDHSKSQAPTRQPDHPE